jgi:HK97 family phage portal protein
MVGFRDGLVETRATPENPTFSLSDPRAWDMILQGEPVASGVRVNEYNSLSLPPLWQGVCMISGDIARMPLHVYRRNEEDGDDSREVDRTHPAYKIIRRMWSRETKAKRGWQIIVAHALLWGNGYAYIVRNGRTDPAELVNLMPDRTAPERLPNGELVYVTETVRPDGSPWLKPIPADDVFHIQGLSLDPLAGMPMIQTAKDSIGLALAAAGFASKFFKNGVRAGGILEVPAAMGNPAAQKLEKQFAEQYSGEQNWFKTIVLRDGAKFHSLTIPPAEGQMMETREAQAREVAQLLNIPPSRLGIQSGGGYNSQMEDSQRYLDSCLSPWLEEISTECWAKLLSKTQQDTDSHYFEYRTDKILSMNPLQRAQNYAMALRNMWMTPNEVRRIENMPPVEWGDTPITAPPEPGASAGGVDKMSGDDVVTPPRGSEDASGGEAGPSESTRNRRRVAFAVAAQARHKAKKPNAFIEWVDGGLVSHRQSAIEAYGEDSSVDGWLTELRNIAETASATSLDSAVNDWALKLESI